MKTAPSISERKTVLQLLLKNIVEQEEAILDALYKDFKKPKFEGVATETSYIIGELKETIAKIERWAKPERVTSSILNFPSKDKIYKEPFGQVLIIAPWNYPFQLAISPLIAAIAAGNRVTVKPSELTPNTAEIIAKIVRETFEIQQVIVITGDASIAQNLLAKRWDYIFFTGSVGVGKIVAQAAAQNLTPVTLELGGKNPCIVDQTADIQLAAKRIIWGKIVNAGQTCIAPDYILVHTTVKPKLITALIAEIERALGKNPQQSNDFARIVNLKNWKRQLYLLENQTIIYGAQSDKHDLYLSPTLIDEPKLDSPLMHDEIFGPILPILSYSDFETIDKIISSYEKPLACYVFSTNDSFTQKIITNYSFGGGCINDTMMHFANKRLPFGGVGHSGMGAYHGKRSFDLFSHHKAVVKKANWLDIPLRYAPYEKKFTLIRKLLKWI